MWHCGIYAETEHSKTVPDHSVICAFRKENKELFSEVFTKVLLLAQQMNNMSAKEKMASKLKTNEGKDIYKKRKETVEPVFGIIKHVMGFRQFMVRGIDKVNTEWELVKAAYNFKRLHNLLGRRSLSECLA